MTRLAVAEMCLNCAGLWQTFFRPISPPARSFETKLQRVQCCQRLTKRRSNCNAVWSDRLLRGEFGSNVRKPTEIIDCQEGSTSEPHKEVNDGEGAVIVELIQRLSSGEIDGQRDAVKELRSLTKESPDKKILIARAGSIPMLVDLLSTRDPETREHAVTTLLNLSLINANKEAIVHAGAIDAIVEVLRSGSMEARENAAALLFSLSVLDENKVSIGQSGALSPLVDLCRDGTMRGRNDAASALFNLSLHEENKPKLVSAGIVPPLVQLLGEPAARMVDVALAILSLIAPHEDCTAAVADASAIPVLLDIMKSGSPGNKENAVVVLLALSENDSAQATYARKLGVWPYAAELARSSIPRCRKKASHLLELLQSIEHECH